jgi:CheY-like chemotaxis protein
MSASSFPPPSSAAPSPDPTRLAEFAALVGEVAHDFNNLLAVITANLDLLSEQSGHSDENRMLIEEALTAATRGSEKVRELLIATRGGAPGAQGPASAGNPSPGKGEVVLLVDDNERLRAAVVRQLESLGYRVLEAADGPAALMVLNTERVDLLLTDVVMPGNMSGFDLARLVLSRWPGMKALITSGFPELEPSIESMSAGTLRRLAKPFTKDELASALHEVLAP